MPEVKTEPASEAPKAPERKVEIVPLPEDDDPVGMDVDAALAQMDDGYGDDDEEAPGSAPAGEEAEDASDAAESAEDAGADEGDAPGEEHSAEDAPPPDPAIVEARQVLSRAKYPDSVIDKLTDVELLSLAHRVDNERRDREREFQKLKKTDDGSTEAPGSTAEAPGSPSWLTELSSPFADVLGLEGDDRKAVDEYTANVISPLVQVIDQQQERLVRMEQGLARSELRERFPQLLGDAEAYKGVVKKMETLNKDGSYTDATELMAAACEVLEAPRLREEAAQARKDLERRKARSASPSPASSPPKKREMSAEEREDLAIDLIEQGKTAEAERLMREA